MPGACDGHVTWPQLCGCLGWPNSVELKTGTSPCLLTQILSWGLAANTTQGTHFSAAQTLGPPTQGSAGNPRAVDKEVGALGMPQRA